MHDTRKSGNQEEFENNKFTKFDHPLLAASVVRHVDKGKLSDNEIECVACAIESHMGQWNTDKSGKQLPLPRNDFQKILHLSDYLASRKDLEIVFDDSYYQLPDINEYVLTFGKHKGKTLIQVNAEDPSYIKWAKENMTMEPAKSLLRDM